MADDRLSIASLGWGAISGILASLSVLVSVTYDWGFFFALDMSYATAPTTIVDHVQSWLYWIPALIFPGIGFLFAYLSPIENPVHHLSKNSTPSEISDAVRLLKKRQIYLICTMILFSVILLVLSYARYNSIYPIGWFGLIPFWFLWYGRFRTRFPVIIAEILIWFPPLLAFAFLSGSVHAKFSLGQQDQTTHRLVVVDNGEFQNELDVNIVRTFQHWFLVVENNDQMVWIPSVRIKRMDVLRNSQ